MNTRLLFFLLAAALLVGGCATQLVDPLVARRRAYERILKNIEPGMTRRQLYAMLPPKGKPEVTTPDIFSMAGIIISPIHSESYPLDRDFSLAVGYVLANEQDYIWLSSSHKGFEERCPLELFADTKKWSHAIHRKGPPSKENPDDEISKYKPVLVGPGCRGSLVNFIFPLATYYELFIPKNGKK